MLQITPAERAALQMLADGHANREIADRLGTSEHLLDAELTKLFGRMGITNRREAIAAAVRRGLVTSVDGHEPEQSRRTKTISTLDREIENSIVATESPFAESDMAAAWPGAVSQRGNEVRSLR